MGTLPEALMGVDEMRLKKGGDVIVLQCSSPRAGGKLFAILSKLMCAEKNDGMATD
jgi:hypothetical protein